MTASHSSKKLTQRACLAARYTGTGNSRQVLWDGALPGFGLRIYPSQRKSFVVSYRSVGRKRLMVLGSIETTTVEIARLKARKILADGADPIGDRRLSTVAELCAEYMTQYAKIHKKTWKDDERRINNRIVPAWGGMRAASLTHADVAALHHQIGADHKYEANRVVEMVSKIYSLGQQWGWVDTNPAKGLRHFKEEKRDRWVTPDELPRLAEAINQESNPFAKAALWLYLLTGVRKSELLTARWDDVDADRRELRLPETKSGRVHYVPLTEPALGVLRQLPRVEGNPYILVGLKRGQHLVNIQNPWKRVRKAAGCDDVRLHDLRRTVGSWLAQSGNSLHLIGRVLNHKHAATTAVYARFGEDSLRTAMEGYGQRLMGIASGEKAEVVKLRGVK